jgi:hypothetical protein
MSFLRELFTFFDESCQRDRVERIDWSHRNQAIRHVFDTVHVQLSVLEKLEVSIIEEVPQLRGLSSSSISTNVDSIGELRSICLSHQQTSTSDLSGIVRCLNGSIHDDRSDVSQIDGRVMGVNRAFEGRRDQLMGDFKLWLRERKDFKALPEKLIRELKESGASQAIVISPKDDRSCMSEESFSFSADRRLEGIISYLNKSHNGNVMEKDIIGVTASSEYGSS